MSAKSLVPEESAQAGRKSQKKLPNSTAGGECPPTKVPTVETGGQKEAYLQVGRYLLEQFSAPAFRSHATIGLVDRDRIQFYHANRSVILVSSAISFSTRHKPADVDKFIAVVIAFSRLSLCESGILHNLQAGRLVPVPGTETTPSLGRPFFAGVSSPSNGSTWSSCGSLSVSRQSPRLIARIRRGLTVDNQPWHL